ncbi:hypothetical protein AB0M41_07175 [Streptomyces sp. NPDC051896]|uniref:hypothetical protein n=1 Tax=Streptomyces sp. NPDC051896 TaxID=3155416 RepID=UPI00343D2ADE
MEITPFRVSESDLAAMNQAHVGTMSDTEMDEFIDRHSIMYGRGEPHDYDYISLPPTWEQSTTSTPVSSVG